ncbi:ATP-binding protein [Methylobacterium sp. WSM2598]|uniref:ATP-binding protein n=1 Tax=Methylobacterium sp. WSM2598 TaxID=398261 RepID=UPI000365E511|nr:ATP-binding protein [Methylobacterium sp. WSM2598]
MARDHIGAGQESLSSLESVLITPELEGRPSRPPDYERQARALDVLATALAETPGDALQELVEVIVELCDAGSAGISLAEQEAGATPIFRWVAVAGTWADKRGGRMPIDASPCGVVVARNTTLLFAHPEQHFAAAKVEPLISEILLVPLRADERPIGTVWAIAHDPARRFDREDARLLLSLSRLAGAIAQTTASLAAARESEANLRRLNTDLERQVAARSRERSLLWQHTLDLLSVIDLPSATFERVNPAWTTLLGWTAREMEGRPYAEFVHPDDLAASAAAFEAVRRGDPMLHFENRYRSREGSWRRLSWSAVPEGDKLYSTTRDVTAERAQAEALAQAEEALRQSQKMEAVGQLTGGLAHDVNNMLQGIRGALQMMERRIAGGRLDELPRLFRMAEEGVQRAAALTRGLLAFARRGQLDPKVVVVDDLVTSMTDLIRRTVGPGIEVRARQQHGSWRVRLDPSGLQSALLNLAINARDAMPEGGLLTFETEEVTLTAEALGPEREVAPGDFVLVTVSDTGSGMPPEVLARVFEPFFTTKPQGQGTGLGLSQLYGFVRQSGGFVRVASAVGTGTRVCLFLPRHCGEGDRGGEPAPGRTARKDDGVGRTVLLVEDEGSVRSTIAERLRDAGYDVLEAGDGPAGLAILAGAARVDLLLTDVGLPGLNGRQLAEDARAQRPTLPVLFITGYAGLALEGALPPGMAAIAKPFPLDALADRVGAIIEKTPDAPDPQAGSTSERHMSNDG